MKVIPKKYCKFCGTRMIHVRNFVDVTFDENTGERVEETYAVLRCPHFREYRMSEFVEQQHTGVVVKLED